MQDGLHQHFKAPVHFPIGRGGGAVAEWSKVLQNERENKQEQKIHYSFEEIIL